MSRERERERDRERETETKEEESEVDEWRRVIMVGKEIRTGRCQWEKSSDIV